MTKVRIVLAACAAAGVLLLATAGGATGVATDTPRYVAPASDGSFRVAALFGESDEEKAARLQHEADQDAQIRALGDKLRDMEDTVSRLTGQNEELSHRVGELNDKIDRQRKDFEYRLCALSAQQLGASTGQDDPNAVPCPGSAVAPSAGAAPSAVFMPSSPAAQAPQAPQSNIKLAPPPGNLGTLPAGTPMPSAQPAGAEDASRADFTAAMNLLAKARYDEASAAFRGYADANPQSDLAPQAVYWIGSIAMVQKDYAGATRAFAEVIKKYPTSSRAPDSMLKLGQALLSAGQKKEGCTALAALPVKYPKAGKGLLTQGTDARKAAGCRSEG